MQRFPEDQSEIVALARTMIAGCMAHPRDFPNVKVTNLQNALDAYMIARGYHSRDCHPNCDNVLSQDCGECIVQSQIVTKVDNEFLKLAELEHTIRQCLQQAEEDANGSCHKLRNIGWG